MKFTSGEKYVVGNMLEEAARKYKDRTYFIFEGRSYSYSEVNETASLVAANFAGMGVRKGDHVAILMDNCPEFIFTWFGLARIGAIEAPFNPFHKGNILEYLINYSDAKILVISSSFIEEIAAIEGSLKTVKKVIISGTSQPGPFKSIEAMSFSSLLDGKSAPPRVDVTYKDILALMFTSGTTGPSKGVLITHNQGFFVASQYLNVMGIRKSATGYCYIPLFHEAPQFGLVLGTMFYGGQFVLTRGFSPADFWNDIRKYNCTVSGMFEVVIKILLMAPEKPDDADNPMQIFSTAHVGHESQVTFEKRFGVKLVNTYGLTEGTAPSCQPITISCPAPSASPADISRQSCSTPATVKCPRGQQVSSCYARSNPTPSSRAITRCRRKRCPPSATCGGIRGTWPGRMKKDISSSSAGKRT